VSHLAVFFHVHSDERVGYEGHFFYVKYVKARARRVHTLGSDINQRLVSVRAARSLELVVLEADRTAFVLGFERVVDDIGPLAHQALLAFLIDFTPFGVVECKFHFFANLVTLHIIFLLDLNCGEKNMCLATDKENCFES
jgi:hypothetical protein